MNKEACTDFDVLIRPINTAPTWSDTFSDKSVNNYNSLIYNLPECQDIDPNDELIATYEYTKAGGSAVSSLSFVDESRLSNGQFRIQIEPFEIPQVGLYQACVTC